MASIIQGYNYDIFISYGQKDNKGDRWVSEFEAFVEQASRVRFRNAISASN